MRRLLESGAAEMAALEIRPDELDQLAIAVATDADGAAIAFATFRPTGIDGGWVLDLLRRAPGGTPGARSVRIHARLRRCHPHFLPGGGEHRR